MKVDNILSVCNLRQFYNIGCHGCIYLDKCLNYQNNNKGLKPYEVEKIQRNDNTSKEKEENGGF